MKFKLFSPAVVVSLVTLCSCVPPKNPSKHRVPGPQGSEVPAAERIKSQTF